LGASGLKNGRASGTLARLMNPKLKLTAYGALLILCVWFGLEFYSNYSAVTKAAAEAGANAPAAPADTSTNASTNEPANTNAAAGAPSTNAATPPGTNVAASSGPKPPPAQTNAPAPSPLTATAPAPAPDVNGRRSAMIAYLAALVGAIVGLGLLIATDVTQFMGSQAIQFLFNDAGEGQRDPEYERAEGEWANGKFLDAIQMMRDFLKKNPRELYAALRIAEIYEKDLKNYLAAALEYEEVLKHRFSAERWGWAAIHLCNLYFRLNQSDKALALLRRVAEEYPKTAAAKKARARLGIAEPEPEAAEQEASAEAEPEANGLPSVIIMEEHPPELQPRKEAPPALAASSEPSEPPKPVLPPGFRPKK
jgi:TolA-binding protein